MNQERNFTSAFKPRSRFAAWMAGALALSALLFGLGVFVERHAEAPTGNLNAPEGSPEREAAERGQSAASETLFSINPDATAPVALALAVMLGLAAVAWLSPIRPALAVIALAGILFGIIDIREVVHQAMQSRPTLTALASAIAVLHLALVPLAWVAVRDARTQPQA